MFIPCPLALPVTPNVPVEKVRSDSPFKALAPVAVTTLLSTPFANVGPAPVKLEPSP